MISTCAILSTLALVSPMIQKEIKVSSESTISYDFNSHLGRSFCRHSQADILMQTFSDSQSQADNPMRRFSDIHSQTDIPMQTLPD